jgi:hypothetical protein
MERHAVRDEAQLVCIDQHIDGHLRNAAELARQRPFGAFAVGQHPAEHASPRCGTGDLLDFLMAVDGKQRHAERMGAGDVAFFLDGVAIGNTGGSRAGLQRHLDFGDRGAIEVGAEIGEQTQDLRRRIGLHRIEDRAVGQRLAERGKLSRTTSRSTTRQGTIGTAGAKEIENACSRHRVLRSRPFTGHI